MKLQPETSKAAASKTSMYSLFTKKKNNNIYMQVIVHILPIA